MNESAIESAKTTSSMTESDDVHDSKFAVVDTSGRMNDTNGINHGEHLYSSKWSAKYPRISTRSNIIVTTKKPAGIASSCSSKNGKRFQ